MLPNIQSKQFHQLLLLVLWSAPWWWQDGEPIIHHWKGLWWGTLHWWPRSSACRDLRYVMKFCLSSWTWSWYMSMNNHAGVAIRVATFSWLLFRSALALAMAFVYLHLVCSGYPSLSIFSGSASSSAYSAALMLLKTLFIAGSHILNHPGVLEVASSIPNMFSISRNTWSLYKLQITSDSFTLNLFDFHEQPLIIRQLLESHVVSSWQCDQNCKTWHAC